MEMKQKKIFIIAGIAAAVLIAAAVIWGLFGSRSSGTASGKQGLEFPYELADGKLKAVSLFQSSVVNPDCGDTMGEDIASLEVINQSDEHLASAQFTAKLKDGTELTFEVQDVPAGAKVWAFEKSNAVYDTANICESLKCDAQFEDKTTLMEDKIEVKVKETEITLTNRSDEDLTDLTVRCHCLFDGEAYYGGRVYDYPVEKIAAGESVKTDASDCYLGEAAVVRITQNS